MLLSKSLKLVNCFDGRRVLNFVTVDMLSVRAAGCLSSELLIPYNDAVVVDHSATRIFDEMKTGK